MGNILELKRQEQTSAANYGLIDNLTLTYDGNQLKKVIDSVVSSAYGNGFYFKDRAGQDTEYIYDAIGNLTKDLNKKIANIEYNYLVLSRCIQFEDGTKLRTTHVIIGVTTTTDYCGNEICDVG